MVRDVAHSLASWLSEGKSAVALVMLGIWLGVLTQRVLTLEAHPSEEAHREQLVKTIQMQTQLAHANDQITRLESFVTELRAMAEGKILRMKADILTEVITRHADQRWRRGDMANWVRRTERMNASWRGADVFTKRNSSPEQDANP